MVGVCVFGAYMTGATVALYREYWSSRGVVAGCDGAGWCWRGSPSPQPSPASGRGSKTARRANQRPDPAKAERSDGPCGLHLPSGRAEKRRAWGGHGLRSKPMLRALTRCGCLSGARKREASSAAPPRARASQVARSEAKGHGQWGRLFFGYFLLARQKKVTAPPGAHPGQQRLQSMPDSPRRTQPLTPALSPTGRGRKP